MIFEVVEYAVIGPAMFLQPLMFVVGLLLIALAAREHNDEPLRGAWTLTSWRSGYSSLQA